MMTIMVGIIAIHLVIIMRTIEASAGKSGIRRTEEVMMTNVAEEATRMRRMLTITTIMEVTMIGVAIMKNGNGDVRR